MDRDIFFSILGYAQKTLIDTGMCVTP